MALRVLVDGWVEMASVVCDHVVGQPTANAKSAVLLGRAYHAVRETHHRLADGGCWGYGSQRRGC